MDWHPSHRTWHRSPVHRHSGNRTWRESAARPHPVHRITVAAHLRRRSRGCESACCHATKENEFSPVHSVIGFKDSTRRDLKSIAGPASKVTPLLLLAPRFRAQTERTPFELARVVVRLDHVACRIVARITASCDRATKLLVANRVADRVGLAVALLLDCRMEIRISCFFIVSSGVRFAWAVEV